jgi:Co/Zn/Cd efflux system component
MSIKSNIKDIVTDLIGAVIWIATLYLVYFEKHPWLWDGIIGMIIGGVFFLIPDDILSNYAQKFLNKKIGEDDKPKP